MFEAPGPLDDGALKKAAGGRKCGTKTYPWKGGYYNIWVCGQCGHERRLDVVSGRPYNPLTTIVEKKRWSFPFRCNFVEHCAVPLTFGVGGTA